jgi:oligoribonuclease NrnB/cAMP/cGMP phosphodiesterase (DHH superfamily)
MNAINRQMLKSWQEIIKEFKAQKPEYDGAAAALILMYLAVIGEDYPYQMAKRFEEGLIAENGWDEVKLKFLRSLKKESQLRTRLKEMVEKGLLVSRKEQQKYTQKFYHYYSLDPWIFVHYQGEHCPIPQHKKQINDEFFLAAEFQVSIFKDDVKPYFKSWSSLARFDFITFLIFLMNEAEEIKNEKMVKLLDHHINRISRQEEFKAIDDIRAKFKHDYEKRGIK